jgi:hypothetical protein
VAVAKAYAIAAQIWSDYCQGTLMAYQPLINGKEMGPKRQSSKVKDNMPSHSKCPAHPAIFRRGIHFT